MAKQDYYETLGIEKNATPDEIKKAYRKMAMQYHPDKNQGDKTAEEQFKKINEAYEILKDPQKKASYDQFGHQAFQNGQGGHSSQQGGQGFGGFDFNFAGGGGGFSDIFSDIFSDFMGGGNPRSQSPRNKGNDLRYDITITLDEAFNGTNKTISFRRQGKCKTCAGLGGDESKVCPLCKGNGVIAQRQGFFVHQQPCPECGGIGHIIKNPCKDCNGTGIETEAKTLDVKIPAGVDTDTRLRIHGEGEAGLVGGQPGDLYVYIAVKPSRVFKRDGKNLYIEVPIPFTLASLGGDIAIPIIEGSTTEVKIPAGTQPNSTLRLKGKGMPNVNSSIRGDMYLEITVEIPTKLSVKQTELLKEFEAESQRSGTKSFFDKIKEWL